MADKPAGLFASQSPVPIDAVTFDHLQTDGAGNLKVNVAAGGASGGTSSTFNSAFPGTGTAAGASDGTNMKPLAVDGSGNLLVNVAAGGAGGGAVTVANGADVVEGALADAAVVTDANGTLSGKLRGLVVILLRAFQLATPLRIDPTGGTVQPVSASALPLPSGAATEATLSTLNGKVTAVNTGAVVVSSSALPTGASTAAKQPALGTAGSASADVLSVQGISGGTALPVSLASVPLPSGAATEATLSSLNGKVTAVNTGAVTISAALPAGTNAIGKLAANSGVDIGDVDVTSVPADPFGVNAGYASPAPLFTNLVGSQCFGIAMSPYIQTTAAAVVPTWTWQNSNGNAFTQAVFKVAPTGGAIQPSLMMLGVGS